jgi:adenine-specific DNA-methyltransferase
MPSKKSIRVLDPGAGTGILSVALINRLLAERPDLEIEVVAVEVDEALYPALQSALDDIEALGNVKSRLVKSDFLEWALSTNERFDLIVQNPPYAKLKSGSPPQNILRSAGIDVPNIYAAFLALGLRLLLDNGQQIAITPRSWLNGTYYSRFRREFVGVAGIDSIHSFESRSNIFRDSNVLQEAIVVASTRGRWPKFVQIFTSHDHQDDARARSAAYSDVVTEDFIHVPATQKDADAVAWMMQHARYSLEELGLAVSTGRVVSFRARDKLLRQHVDGALPFVTPSHIRNGRVNHPVGTSKPEWFQVEPESAAKMLVPPGVYVVVKRFSAKEERRRISAGVWESHEPVAFDNKLNYVHQNGNGLELRVALGLAVFLNSSRFDDHFRVFSGHTQVNATDLRLMRFPSLEQLTALSSTDATMQRSIDEEVENVLARGGVTE